MPIAESHLSLCCHPTTPAPTVRAIEARADWQADGALRLSYRLWGDMARIRIPAPQSPGSADLLWQHTCFEAFIGIPGDPAYREFNFSPSRQWAAYAFRDYRQRDELMPVGTPEISVQCFAGRLELLATLVPDSLPTNSSLLEIGLSAVVEADDIVDGAHSYWALHHPAPQPDFHHRAAFALSLPTPQTT